MLATIGEPCDPLDPERMVTIKVSAITRMMAEEWAETLRQRMADEGIISITTTEEILTQ